MDKTLQPAGTNARLSTTAFRKRFYPQATASDWNDWRWQLKHRIQDLEEAQRIFTLAPDERGAIAKLGGRMPLGLTPYYASLMDLEDPADPLRRTKLPDLWEFERAPGESQDPLGEETHHAVPGLVHTYPDKVLFLVTDFCATYCRYCMRSRLVGKGSFLPDHAMWERALDYIRQHQDVRDVLLSGGDPLIMADERLEWLLQRLRAIPHVEFIRIGTKVPAVLPQRVTPALVRMLKKYHPLFMSLHFVHPRELSPECARACGRLADAGIPLGGQMVLLKGVNDAPETVRALNLWLLRQRCQPYYMFQCDMAQGISHLRTPLSRGLEIIAALRGWSSGMAVPHFVVDLPGGGGKVTLTPEAIVAREEGWVTFRSYQGRLIRFRDLT